MIQINVRTIGEYLQIGYETFDAIGDLGLFDEAEAEQQLLLLKEAIDMISEFLNKDSGDKAGGTKNPSEPGLDASQRWD